MKTTTTPPTYKGFRFPPEIINHAVWLYFRFSLSYRDVEELLAQRGIVVTFETVRQGIVNLFIGMGRMLRYQEETGCRAASGLEE